MLRFDIINLVIKVNGFTKYLEIGVCNPLDCFDKVNCELKHGVDPGYEFEENPVTYQMESDTFFEYLKEHDPNRKYDVIFIDGLHKSYQVKKDIENSLEVLSPNGYVLLHDCNPPTSHMARETYRTEYGYEPWNGTVWKAIYQLRTTRKDLHVSVVDTDWGIGIIKRNELHDTKPIENNNEFYEYNIMDANREEDLGLISIEEFLNGVEE